MAENFLIKLLDWLWDLMERRLLPFAIVNQYEGGVVLLLGKFHYKLKKGFNWKWPLLHESLTCLMEAETLETSPKTITTKDGKTLSVSFVGRYRIVDEFKFLLKANDGLSNIPHELIMSGCDYLTDCTLSEVIEKPSYTKIKNRANSKMEYMGVEFIEVGYSTNTITRPISLINH